MEISRNIICWGLMICTLFIIFNNNNGVEASHEVFLHLQSSPSYNNVQQLHRTAYHFQPPKNWINDPNGPMYYKGVYHLFYQYNPKGAVWGNIVWAHAVSTDMINWKIIDPAIYPSKPFDKYGCWSGSATILPGNKPIILYTGIVDENNTQVQNYAIPADYNDPYLTKWIKPDNNPLITADVGVNKTAFRDPTTAWVGPDGLWTGTGAVRSKRIMRTLTSYFRKADNTPNLSATERVEDEPEIVYESPTSTKTVENAPEIICEDTDLPEIISDPGKRPSITDYHPNIRERVRRQYIINGPCQPKLQVKDFPQTLIRDKKRRFNRLWFNDFHWLEYSIEKDAAFCLCCYLFKNYLGHQGGGDTFVSDGFTDWSRKDKLQRHVGGIGSAHRQASQKCLDLMNDKQHIETKIVKMTDEAKKNYRAQLNATIDCIKWLLRQGLAFRGRDESHESNNQGNFLELMKFLADHSEEVRKVVLKNAPRNLQLTSPRIQKDIVNACAYETTKAIIEDVGGSFFSVLLDDSRDVSTKEQMAVVLRFVDKKGCVLERIFGFKHVKSTSAISLKCALEDLLHSHGLSISMLRGQGYDGASNMKGEFNGLKALILQENETAYYVHCFAHQLQLALVAVAKKHVRICELFVLITSIVNVVGGSCKRKDSLREKQAAKILQELENEEITSGRGLNQESTLIRPSDTRWSSHYHTILSLINLFDSTIGVLREIIKDGSLSNQRGEASRLVRDMLSFDFVFDIHLMKSILGITNELCLALQRKEQDIVSAMNLVSVSKERLQIMRERGWNDLIDEVSTFCVKHEILVPDMDDMYTDGKRRKRNDQEMTNDHRYRVEVFTTVLDTQLLELNERFNEANTELLLCVACLNPSHSFKDFDKKKLVRLAKFYPGDFQDVDILALPDQLENYFTDMSTNVDMSGIHDLGEVTQKMVETRRHLVYPLVFKLITLALVLPVATATVERAFSAMNIVKSRLRNKMCDEWMNDNLVVYIEKDIFNCVSNDAIIERFQSMTKRRGQL